jgi:hypothetical protein
MMKDRESELLGKIDNALRTSLQKVPFLEVVAMERSISAGDMRPDIVATVRVAQKQRRIALEVKSNGQPRMVRTAAYQLQRYQQDNPDVYCIVAAPYISPQAADICAKEGIGYLDLAGNCRITFDQVYIEQEGKSNPFAQKRDLRSLYSPKAARVLRVLLNDPKTPWKVKPLADKASVSFGQISNVKSLLDGREWITTVDAGFLLSVPEQLLVEWAENYDFRKNTVRNYYTLKSVADIEADLAVACEERGIPYALAGFSATARFAPTVRYQRAMAYVARDVEEMARMLSLKEVSSGANVTLLTPYDEGVLYGTRLIEGVRVTAPVQTYLDLVGIKGRGEEAASALMEEVIRKSW